MTRFAYNGHLCKIYTDSDIVFGLASRTARRSTARMLSGKILSWTITMNADDARALQSDLERNSSTEAKNICNVYTTGRRRNLFINGHGPVN